MASPNISGQMTDPGRVTQTAAGQAPSGQTGVQHGKHLGVPLAVPAPQTGTEPNTQGH